MKLQFFLLPSSVSVEILSVWCDAKAMAKFDTAMAEIGQRPKMLNLFVFANFTFGYTSKKNPTVRLMTWLSNRNIKLSSLSFTVLFFCENSSFFNSLNVSKMKDLNFILDNMGNTMNKNVSVMLADFCNNCHCLEKLKINAVYGSHDLLVSFFIAFSDIRLSILKFLDITVYNFPAVIFRSIGERCTNLLSLKVSITDAPLNEQIVCLILKSNRKLQVVNISANSEGGYFTGLILVVLAQYCIGLRSLTLVGCDEFTITTLPFFISSLSDLQFLSLKPHYTLSHTPTLLYKTNTTSTANNFTIVSNNTNKNLTNNNLTSTYKSIFIDHIYSEHCALQVFSFFERVNGLNEVKLHDCDNVSDALLTLIVDNNDRLSVLMLYNCSDKYTFEPLRQLIVKHKAHLKKCVSTFNAKLSDMDLLELAFVGGGL